MGLGTKNRQKQTADICKLHLREKYRDQRELVEEFIVEIEGTPKNCDVTRWGRSPISKTSKKRCSSASRLISRSGSIREVDESIFAKLALAEFSERPKIVEFFGRWEAQQRAHCGRRTLSTGTVACTRLIDDPCNSAGALSRQ